jgi:DNA polymerase-3 subunit gamma/tau
MYLALYRKYRPRTFSEVISQPHITITLQNQIKSGQIAHAYLFTGSRGTGKTTCAKILAKAINCTGNVSQAGSDDLGTPPEQGIVPCRQCESCQAADKSPDIQEIDAASNNGVEDIRALREEAGYLPSELKYKVYIIDEVHMLSASAFNALLKTLEEPPPHVVFILATTEIHKIPATVLSRCQRYEFNRINSEESAAALIKIAQKEGITLEKDAALLISRLSDGGMRDALSLLDVAAGKPALPSATEGGSVTVTQQDIRDCAGIAGKEHLFSITDAIAKGDGKSALTITSELYAKSKDPTRLIDELLQHFRNLMIVKIMPGDFSLLTVLQEEIPEYDRQANLFTIEAIMDCLDKLEDCLRLKGRKVEAEICLMRLCVGNVGHDAHGTSIKPQPAPVPTPTPIPELPPVPMPTERINAFPTPVPEPPTTPEQPNSDFPDWQSVLERLDPFKAAMLEEAVAKLSGNVIVVTGNANLSFFFENPDNRASIEKAAREATEKDYKIVFDAGHGGSDTPPEPQPPIPEPPKQSKIDQFLTDVEASGVQMTIQ